jgi:hypothetical protein
LHNPILDLERTVSARDPLLLETEGLYHCYYTAVEETSSGYRLNLDEIRSKDLLHWSAPRRLLCDPWDSPVLGALSGIGTDGVMALQSYPILPVKLTEVKRRGSG